jgi:hypothetical protein
MKRILLSLCLLVFVLFAVNADWRVPSSVFTMEELDDAKARAQEQKEPLIFVYTDPGSS